MKQMKGDVVLPLTRDTTWLRDVTSPRAALRGDPCGVGKRSANETEV